VTAAATTAAPAIPTLLPTSTPLAAAAASPSAPTPTPTNAPPPGAPLPDLFSQEPPAGNVAYLLPLTVRHVTETSAVLFFELDQPAAGALYYRPAAGDPGAARAVPLDPSQTRHQITLEALQPGVEYQAQVGVSAADGSFSQPAFQQAAWGSLRFRTASGRAPLRFGVFGDASFGDTATLALMERMQTYDLDFAIHTGDVVAEVQDDPSPAAAYASKFYATLSALLHRMPIYTVIGNHDYDAPARWQERPFYFYAFPPFTDPQFLSNGASNTQQYYAFTYQGVQFLMLDTQVLFGVEGRQAQEAWMAERLADPRFRYTIPVFHVPPFFSGSVHPSDGDPVRQFWRPRFAEAHVPVAFSGHSHHYERLLADDTTYIVSGGGSSILYAAGEMRPESQIYVRRTHFVLVQVYADRIELTAIDKDGETFDTWTIPTP
jgi:acid phosphatase